MPFLNDPEMRSKADMEDAVRRADNSTVINIEEFVKKWGVRTPSLMIEKAIMHLPGFKDDVALARVLGEMVADLSFALAQVRRDNS